MSANIEQIKAMLERAGKTNILQKQEVDFDKEYLQLQQEQPENIVAIARTFLDALSKTPYNNKPITDAQIIVKQLLLFFENPKEYNPDAILEQPEADLEKELENFAKQYPMEDPGSYRNLITLARHFYELGLNARKEN